jgi:hypothetical protein
MAKKAWMPVPGSMNSKKLCACRKRRSRLTILTLQSS